MFHFQPFQPSPALRNYVHCYLVAEVVDNGDLMMIHEALPMAITTICFADSKGCYSNRTGSSADFLHAPDIAMVGQMLQKGESIFSRPSRSVVALFKVTGLYQLGGIPMNLVAGRYSVDATSLLSAKELSECREQMFQHTDAAKMVSVLDDFLLKKFKTRPGDMRNIDKVAEYINQKKGNVNLDWLTNQTCMSVKTLERHFAEKIGLTPKYFSRILRFKNAFSLLEKNARHKDVMKIVDMCGYTDQAHLIKEFNHFTGRTPKFYYGSPEVLSPYFLKSSSKE
jgi:AraC-like DNA-binding protein